MSDSEQDQVEKALPRREVTTSESVDPVAGVDENRAETLEARFSDLARGYEFGGPDVKRANVAAEIRFRLLPLAGQSSANNETREPDEDAEMNVRQTAEVLGVSENTVRNWADRGVLPVARKLPSGFRRFNSEAVERMRKEMWQGFENREPLIGEES